jgi:dihydropteridine reductase
LQLTLVAGGWQGGNLLDENFLKSVEGMYQQSVLSSAIAARLGALHLKSGGLIQFTGSFQLTQVQVPRPTELRG